MGGGLTGSSKKKPSVSVLENKGTHVDHDIMEDEQLVELLKKVNIVVTHLWSVLLEVAYFFCSFIQQDLDLLMDFLERPILFMVWILLR
jgi:hypothetical protein